MDGRGRARAPAAGTVLNAIATGMGSAFAIDAAYTTATVRLDGRQGVEATIDGAPDADTRLIERCVSLTLELHGDPDGASGGTVRTESDIPMAAGLKSSSAAANATVLATLEALGRDDVDRLEAARIGVRAAREVGVTVTGAFDDASASMLGGVTVTDNAADQLLVHETVDWDVLVWTPPARAFSADTDVERCERIGGVAAVAGELAQNRRYREAMTINGLAYCAALERPTEPLLEALEHVDGVSLSGTGPSYVAIGDRMNLERLDEVWGRREGRTWLTTTQNEGARTT